MQIMISEAEKEVRREAVEYAKSSVGLEGVTLSKGLLEIADKYIQGLLTREEFTKEYITAVRAGV
ncbi:antitoxin VbhA family protein [Aggregatibacter actinomycetemcomitans]|uniref:antitoxin VbhA family protein n=2 Tax=Aggregatibacter actinomycetemcomitans TaxID=714 RepID=UPI00022AC86C|nr:antitoxin VbhA family protein [Aggregatibacter actinomycetemcomitans]